MDEKERVSEGESGQINMRVIAVESEFRAALNSLISYPMPIMPLSNGSSVEKFGVNLAGKKLCSGPGNNPFRNFVFNGRCNCKCNVKGIFCSECKRNSFYLSAKHQHGCLRCFCSGVSKICDSSNWFRNKLQLSFNNDNDKVVLVYKNMTAVQLPHSINVDEGHLYVDNLPLDSNETYYWKLPETLMGDKLTAYGGYLNFTINYEVHNRSEHKWLQDPLVFMSGNGIAIYYRFRKRNRRIASHFLPIVENVWHMVRRKTLTPFGPEGIKGKAGAELALRKTGKKGRRRRRVKRRDLMNVLADIQYILVKANYRSSAKKVSLLLMAMNDASPNGTDFAERANEVEKCKCPEGYVGLSCQLCSPGYTRNPSPLEKEHVAPNNSNTFHRRRTLQHTQCFPCQCNGYSDTCHEESGKCLNCKPNRAGDYCEHSLLQCDIRGTMKPITLPSIPSRCLCKIGVSGELCDTCKRGYFNLAEENDNGCRRCWCSGVTFNCSSSKLKRFQIRIQPPAFINMGFFDGRRKRLWAKKVNNGKATFNFKEYKDFFNFYWSLPKKFTGNILRSYGGSLNFSLYHHGVCKEKIHMDPFLELESFSRDVVMWKFKPNSISNAPVRFSVRFTEEHFLYYGLKVERIFFLRILSSLKALKIYVPKCRGLDSTEIRNVIMDTAVDWTSKLPIASEVEECQCPKEYSGLSCENCSRGYVKDLSGKKCIPKSTYDHESRA